MYKHQRSFVAHTGMYSVGGQGTLGSLSRYLVVYYRKLGLTVLAVCICSDKRTSFRPAVYPLLDSDQNAVDLTLSNDVAAAAATSLIVNCLQGTMTNRISLGLYTFSFTKLSPLYIVTFTFLFKIQTDLIENSATFC